MQIPGIARQGRVALTGFGNPAQLPGGHAGTILIQAKTIIAGLTGGASTENTDTVLIGIGQAPTVVTTYVGIALAPGGQVEICVPDSADVYIDGANGDAITWTILR
jgi:hypothetical protein